MNAQNYWLRSSFTPNMNLFAVTASDSSNFYIAADSGKIFHSSNAGLNWSIQNTGYLSRISDVNFSDVNTGYAISWEFGLTNPDFIGSIILKTTNGGLNWQTNRVDTGITFSKIFFTDSQNGMLTGYPVGILRTTNGGLNWTTDHIDSATFYDYPIKSFIKRNAQLSLACGGWNDIQGVIWRTTNNGLNWKAQGVAYEPLYSLHFFDDNNVIAVGGDFEYGASMARSTNGGINWVYTSFEQFGIALGMSFRIPTEGWIALSLGHTFLYTRNSGNTWNAWETPNGEYIYDVKFSNNRNGIAVGEHGAILKFNTDYVGIENTGTTIPSNIHLKQNYPNPFNPSTIISFTIQRPEFVTLKIYDMLGKEVQTLINGIINPGEHKINFSAAEIPAGVYYYTLKTESNFTETKKMVLIK